MAARNWHFPELRLQADKRALTLAVQSFFCHTKAASKQASNILKVEGFLLLKGNPMTASLYRANDKAEQFGLVFPRIGVCLI